MARLAAALPCDPASLLRLPLRLFIDTVEAVAKRDAEKWTWDTELLAINAEVTHMLLQSFVRANSKPGTNPGQPLRIPRPADRQREQEAPTRVDGAGLMAWLAGG